MPPDYIDFRLTLEGAPTQGYAVTAHGPGDTYAQAQVPHALDAVQAVLARIELGEAPTPHEMQSVGQRLYELLFAGAVGRLFQQTYAALPAGTHLRLKLHLRTPALARLPWELAYDGQRFLAARLTHPIVRYVESQTPLKLPPLDLPSAEGTPDEKPTRGHLCRLHRYCLRIARSDLYPPLFLHRQHRDGPHFPRLSCCCGGSAVRAGGPGGRC